MYVIYIPCLLGVYGEYTTRAQRYQPSAPPRADISGLGLYIRHIHREDMVYIIYSIVKRKIKVQLWLHSAQYSTIGGCRICSKVGQKAREARRDFGHAPFWHTKITVMTKFSAKMRMILHVCKVEVFLVVGLFIKESNKDFLRLVAMI